MRVRDLKINDDLTISHELISNKVLIIIIDGYQKKSSITEAVFHGKTTIETIQGKAKRIIWNDNELI